MEEQWKPVVGYEGLYEVSNLGRVKSLPRNGTKNYEIILKQSNHRDNYKQVCLRNKTKKTVVVHRLVLMAFIGSPKDGEECDHINRKRDDNRLENLRWVLRAVNNRNQNPYGKSKLKGVYYRTIINKQGRMYTYVFSSIRINNKTIDLGYFKNEIEAYEAYKKAHLKYLGYEWMG